MNNDIFQNKGKQDSIDGESEQKNDLSSEEMVSEGKKHAK